MNKKKIAEIVKFNVEKNIHNKGFVILNIIMFLVVVVTANLGNIKTILQENDINLFEEEFKLEIIDSSGISKGKFEEIYKDSKGIEISYIEKNEYTKSTIPDDVIVVEFAESETNIIKTIITSKEATSDSVYENIKQVSKIVRSEKFSQIYGITSETLELLNTEPEIHENMLGVDAENSGMKQGIKSASVVIVYFVIILILSRIANEIAQEKTSKSIEYVLTSVSAKEYMLAKVLGITLTIVIQLLYSFVYFIIGNAINTIINVSEISSNTQNTLINLDMSMIAYISAMAGYLIFTAFLMCIIQAALSAKATSVAEAGNTVTMLSMITIILYFISLGCINPYTEVPFFMYIISCIPIVSTFFVPAMMIIGQATILQIVVSFALLIISVPIVFNICAEKFKNGILDYSTKKNKKTKNKMERTVKEEQEYLMKTSKIKKFAFVIGIGLLLWLILEELGTIIVSPLLVSLLGDKLSALSVNWIYFIIVSIVSLYSATMLVDSYVEDSYKIKKKVSIKSAIKIILIGWGCIILLQYAESFIVEKIGSDYQILQDSITVSTSSNILEKILFFIGLSVVPGIFEELFVRNAILNYGKQFGKYFALIVSALVFGLMHMNIQQGIFAFILGLIFGVIVLKTSDIRLTIILHMMNNGLQAILCIFKENEILVKYIEIISIALAVIGILLLIVEFIKNKNKEKLFEKEKFKEEYKMIFSNYTFDLVIILFVILTIATESYLRVL